MELPRLEARLVPLRRLRRQVYLRGLEIPGERPEELLGRPNVDLEVFPVPCLVDILDPPKHRPVKLEPNMLQKLIELHYFDMRRNLCRRAWRGHYSFSFPFSFPFSKAFMNGSGTVPEPLGSGMMLSNSV